MQHIFDPPYYGYQHWNLVRRNVHVAGIATAYYGPKRADPAKKSLLLIHGIGGDHHGMMPFGYELRNTYNVYIVELPGHGQTAAPSDRTFAYWKKWAAEVLPAFVRDGVAIDEVVAHSFGCVIAAHLRSGELPVTMLMPVPRPTITYLTYGKVMYYLRYLVAPWYGWYHPALWRGLMLSYKKNRRTYDVISWVSKETRYSPKQFRYQAGIIKDMDGFQLFAGMNDAAIRHTRIIMSSHDTFSTEDYFEMKRDIPHAHITLLPGGHMLPIESPHLLASELYGT